MSSSAWIEQDENREHWQSFLRRRGKRPYRRKPAESAGGARIADRPETIEQRARLGDFEGDTVLGPPGTGGLATLVDRKSRFTIVLKVRSKHADHADPGCPYQRGSNENTNGLIRQYFPKGTDFRDISHHEVRRVEKRLNDRPRACLGFRTPAEVFFEKCPPSGCD